MIRICFLFYFVVTIVSEILAPVQSFAQPGPSTTSAVTNKFYSSSGKWVKVSNTNCLVWSSWPREGESATWTGGVVDGKAHGEGILQWFTNGIPTTSYVGELKAGLADGHGGVKTTIEEYSGDWKRGTLVSTNGTISYVDGSWYRGEIKDGFKTGHGEELMKGGVRYVGQFKNDRFNGKGEMLFPSGDRITGEWRDSKLDGVGIYHRKSGDSFKVKQSESGIERQ